MRPEALDQAVLTSLASRDILEEERVFGFGYPLSPGAGYPRSEWHNFARLGHCGYVGLVSPEMTPDGKTYLHSWDGMYENKRDVRGCGVDGVVGLEAKIF